MFFHIKPQIMLERSRRSSVLTRDAEELSKDRNNLNVNNQYTFSANISARRPSLFQTETMVKMHSAVELNKRILDKSANASLVLMNIPTPPKNPGLADFNCKNIKKSWNTSNS